MWTDLKNLQDPERRMLARESLNGSFIGFCFLRDFRMVEGDCMSLLVCGIIVLLVSGFCDCAGSQRMWVCRLHITRTPVYSLAICTWRKKFWEFYKQPPAIFKKFILVHPIKLLPVLACLHVEFTCEVRLYHKKTKPYCTCIVNQI